MELDDPAALTPEQRLELNKFMGIFGILLNLSDKTFREAAFEVLASNFVRQARLIPFLVNMIMTTIHVRPQSIHMMAKLVKQILMYVDQDHYELSDFRPCLIRIIVNTLSKNDPFPKHTVVPLFLFHLIDKECLTFRDFAAIAKLYAPMTTISRVAKKWIFCVMAPEVEDANTSFFEEQLAECAEKEENPFLQSVFTNFMNEFEELKANDWQKLKNRRLNDFDCFSSASIIEHDQITYLKHQAQGSLFNFDERIEPSVFARSSFVQARPTLVQYAAFYGAAKCFRFLLTTKANLNLTDENGMKLAEFLAAGGRPLMLKYLGSLGLDSPLLLHLAVVHHHHAFFQKLLDTRLTEMKVYDETGLTCIQKAVYANNLKSFLDCYDRGMLPDEGYKGGNTALHVAAANGNLVLCHVLMMLMPYRLNERNNLGQTPLHMAVASGNDKVVLFFLEQDQIQPDVPDYNGLTPMHVAAEYGIPSIVRLVSSMDVNVNARDGKKGCSPFKLTRPKRKLLPTQQIDLIEKDRIRHKRCSRSGRSPLHFAAMNGMAEAVQILMEHFDSDVNLRNNAGQSPLERAADSGSVGVVKILLENPKIDVNAADGLGWTALHSACCRGYVEIVKLLLAREDIDVNARRLPGRAPLHDAADRGNEEIVQLLLNDPRVDPNPQDIANNTPLHWCIERKTIETAKILLECPKTDVSLHNMSGATPLHWAVKLNRNDLIELFFKHPELDINARDNQGATPLLHAARRGMLAMVQILLTRPDVNVTLADKTGQTPFIAATRQRLTDVANVLRGHVSGRSSTRLVKSAKSTPRLSSICLPRINTAFGSRLNVRLC